MLSARASLGVQVFVAGAAIMSLEMVAGRLLAPRFGSTVYTWGALIGVVMAALAAGYYAGGRLADKRPDDAILGLALLGGSCWLLVLPLVAAPMLAAVAHLAPSARLGPTLASLLLVGPATFVLGAVTPIAVRLTTRSLETTGTAAGSMSGLSTGGSIVGTFATVFILFPVLNVNAVLVAGGGLLGAACLLSPGRRALRSGLLVALLAGTLVGQAAFAPQLTRLTAGVDGDVLYSASTPYHELYVVEDTDPSHPSPVRTLLLDGLRNSAIFVDDPIRSQLHYVNFFHLGPLLAPDATRALFVGGGGMSGPKQFLATYPQLDVDVVEIDPEVVEVARRFFAVPEDPRLHVHVEDGRRFLEGNEGPWDIIVLDAYARTWVPFHLLTVEFHRLVLERLAPNGIVVSNLVGSLAGDASDLMRSEVRTMDFVYAWTRQAATVPNAGPDIVQEIIVVASHGTPFTWDSLRERAGAAEDEHGWNYEDTASALTDLQLRDDDVPLLTDAFAPVERLMSPITEAEYAYDQR